MADDRIFNLKYNGSVSSLSQAASMGDLKRVKALLRKGRMIQAADNRGWTAMHSCVAENQLETLKVMLNFRKGNKKYLTNLTTWEGESPLVIALKAHTVSLDIIRLLLKSGSDVNKPTNEGMTPLHYACRKNRNCSVVKLLVEHGAKVDEKEYLDECTPLYCAIRQARDIEIVKFLIDKCDLNVRNVSNKTPLYAAVEWDFFDAVKLILERDSSSINVIPQDSPSPLTIAVINGNAKLVKLLLDAGASAEVSGSFATFGSFWQPLTPENVLPIHLTVDNLDIFRILLQVMNPRTLLHHEEIVPLAVYTLMHGTGVEWFEALLETPLPEELEPLKVVDTGRVADFIIRDPYPCPVILKKIQILFKYCTYLDAEEVLKHIGNNARDYGPDKLMNSLDFLRLLATIGVSSAGAFEAKKEVIEVLGECQYGTTNKEYTEFVKTISEPVLTLKQMSRDAVRRSVTCRAEKRWSAYTTIEDCQLPSALKLYLWCQAL